MLWWWWWHRDRLNCYRGKGFHQGGCLSWVLLWDGFTVRKLRTTLFNHTTCLRGGEGRGERKNWSQQTGCKEKDNNFIWVVQMDRPREPVCIHLTELEKSPKAAKTSTHVMIHYIQWFNQSSTMRADCATNVWLHWGCCGKSALDPQMQTYGRLWGDKKQHISAFLAR